MNICWNIFRRVVHSATSLRLSMSFASLAGWVAMAENDQNAWEECCSRAKQDTEVYSHACISPVILHRSHWGESEMYSWLYYTCSEHRDKYGCDLSTSEKEQWELACKIPKRYCHSAREMSVSAMCASRLPVRH